MSELSNRIKAAIKSSGLSQREIEAKTGIPHSAIQRYASGNTDRVPIGRIEAIAKATGTTAEYLLGWESENNDLEINEKTAEFIMLFDKLTPEQQDMLILQMKGLLLK